MADQGTPITSEQLRQVLDRLNEVMAEAGRLRREVMRQLGEQRAAQRQHLSDGGKRKSSRRKR